MHSNSRDYQYFASTAQILFAGHALASREGMTKHSKFIIRHSTFDIQQSIFNIYFSPFQLINEKTVVINC